MVRSERLEPPMTVKDLSEYLRLDRMTIYKMLKEGSIPASRIGHQWRFFREDIDEWIRSRRISPQTSVLIIDEDSDVRKLLDSELASESVDVVIADSEEDALSRASQRDFDLVFLGLNKATVDLFKDLRELDSTLPVVIIAYGSDGKLVDQVMEIGTFTLMRKPKSAEDVRKIVSSLHLKKSGDA